ncbi:unnamed protein product [Pleuronectes platessa]|uniref:Uncharacterized protein n=1 Tax=Pleuronectes platessa TaxID=8262 RepID=A0A9N7VIL4_PLEPL|nr:unnamed protein product [Pleuronectes platessa]
MALQPVEQIPLTGLCHSDQVAGLHHTAVVIMRRMKELAPQPLPGAGESGRRRDAAPRVPDSKAELKRRFLVRLEKVGTEMISPVHVVRIRAEDELPQWMTGSSKKQGPHFLLSQFRQHRRYQGPAHLQRHVWSLCHLETVLASSPLNDFPLPQEDDENYLRELKGTHAHPLLTCLQNPPVNWTCNMVRGAGCKQGYMQECVESVPEKQSYISTAGSSHTGGVVRQPETHFLAPSHTRCHSKRLHRQVMEDTLHAMRHTSPEISPAVLLMCESQTEETAQTEFCGNPPNKNMLERAESSDSKRPDRALDNN